MTIASELVPRIAYTGDGSQTTFPYPWLVLAATDLAIYQNGILKTLGVHYTLSSVGAPTGGNVVFLIAPGLADTLVFLRDTEASQNTTLNDTGPAGMVAIERGLDRLTMLEQETRALFARVAMLSVFSATQNPTMADPIAGYLMRWKSDLTGLEGVNPTTILPSSATLPLSVANGGTNAVTALAARQSLSVDGQVRKVLTNLTGGGLVAGDLVQLDTAADSTVVLGDTVSSKAQFVIALATIAHAATGEFLLAGIGPLNVTGTITRGRYLRKSATTLVGEDSGTLHGAATDPPTGTLALALTGGTTQVTVAFFGFTYPGNTAPTITGLARVWGLTGANNAGTPATQYDIAATGAVVRDQIGGGTVVLPTVATRTLNLATAGPAEGGRDQVAAFSANTWVHEYLIAQTDGTYHVTASLEPPPVGPALPSGYTLWAYLGALRIDNGSQLVAGRVRGPSFYYDTQPELLTNGQATSETAVAISTAIPPTAADYRIHVSASNPSGVDSVGNPELRIVTGIKFWGSRMGASVTTNAILILGQVSCPNLGTLYYKWTNAPGGNGGLYVHAVSYENPI